ncbi:MAG: AarF/ABC1/UbiB kinase family protein [Myxococcota bacterium]
MTDERRIPEGRLGRLARMAVAGARTGASLLMDRDGEGAAQRAAEVLGTLRGVAAKLGQMAGYVDGVIPEHQREAYETAMRTLQAAAPSSAPLAIRRRVEEQLKAPLDRLFPHWEDRPFASASIGQVHRARLPDGSEVVVKVQHPGIDAALESDLANTGLLETLLNAMGGRRINASSMFQELRTRFLEELDYSLEAQRQQRFAAIHRGDRTIRIPEVITSHSAHRVLTTRLAHGKRFDDACRASPSERRAYAETMWRFVYKGNLLGGMFNADPHPGNYLFGDDGVVTFLDFGCVQPLEGTLLTEARGLHQAALNRDEAAFAQAAARLAGTRGGHYEKMATTFIRRCFEPIFGSPYRMTRAYAAELVHLLRSQAAESRRLPDHEVTEMPPGILFLNRLNFGFYSVLARLDVEVDYAAVERAFMAEHEVKA